MWLTFEVAILLFRCMAYICLVRYNIPTLVTKLVWLLYDQKSGVFRCHFKGTINVHFCTEVGGWISGQTANVCFS